MKENKNKFSNQIVQVIIKFKNFIERYKSIDNCYIYVDKVFKIQLKNNLCKFDIDILHLAEFDPFLYYKLIQNPGKIISIFDYTLNKIIQNKNVIGKKITNKKIKIFFFCSSSKLLKEFNEMDPTNINSLVKVRGYIVNCSPIIPEMISAFFKCQTCFFEIYSFLEFGKILEPIYCFYCKEFNTFQLIYNRCNFTQKRFIQLQPIFNKNKNYTNNNQIFIYTRDYNKAEIGDIVEVIGISRNIPLNCSSKLYKNIFFRAYIDALFFIKVKSECDSTVYSHNIDFSKKISEISQKKNKKILLSSLIQSLYLFDLYMDNFALGSGSFETIKRAIFLQIIGSICNSNDKIYQYSNIILLKYQNLNTKFFFKSLSDSFFNIYSHNTENIFNKNLMFNHNIDFFLQLFLNELETFFNIKKNVVLIHKMEYNRKKKFCKIKEILLIRTDSECKKENKNFFKNLVSILATIDVKKEDFLLLKKQTQIKIFSFLRSRSSDLIYLLKSFNTIQIERKQFNGKIHVLFENLIKNNVEFFKVGLNSNAILKLPSEILRFKSPKKSECLIRDLFKWKNKINKFKKSKITIKSSHSQLWYDSITRLSGAYAKLRLSNTIGPLDVKFSIILILESIKSLNIKKN
nr:minichromosome maintenance complex component 4-like protein [Cryptomonas curvata]